LVSDSTMINAVVCDWESFTRAQPIRKHCQQAHTWLSWRKFREFKAFGD
jgi:hypothetical protein